jgi:hypothetical protein
MEDAEWRIDGEWKMENGKWRMQNGELKMENAELKIENKNNYQFNYQFSIKLSS